MSSRPWPLGNPPTRPLGTCGARWNRPASPSSTFRPSPTKAQGANGATHAGPYYVPCLPPYTPPQPPGLIGSRAISSATTLLMARCDIPKPWSRWGKRRAANPSPTLLVPSTCPRHRPPPSPSSPVVGARMPRPWLPHLRLRALARLGRRHPLFAAFGAVVAQLQPQPAGERRRPVPCLFGPAPASPAP